MALTQTTGFKSIFFTRQYVTLHSFQVGSFKMCKMTGQENGSLFSTKRCNKVNLDFKSIFSRCGGVITDNVVYSKVDNKYGVPLSQGSFKYYVIKEVGGWGQKMAIFADLAVDKYHRSIKVHTQEDQNQHQQKSIPSFRPFL